MCIYIFAPKKTIDVDYAAESMSLSKGGSENIYDVLITNHSNEQVDCIHVVFPHALLTSESEPVEPSLDDLTESWLEKDSPYNRFYETDEASKRFNHQRAKVEVIVDLPDPNHITARLLYKGYIRGKQWLTPFKGLTEEQWTILSRLGWTVATLTFEDPIEPSEPRWLRFRGRTGVRPQNRYYFLEHWARKLCGILTHTFEIAGPLDIRHRIIRSLEAAGVKVGGTLADKQSILELHGLQKKLLIEGMEASGTKSNIKDWRINVFSNRYRRVDDPPYWGDIRPCGGLLNPITSRNGTVEWCYQWKAGTHNVKTQIHEGLFGVRISAHDIPIFTIVLPWISFLLALFALFSRPDLVAVLRFIISF